MPPSAVASVIAALDTLESEPERMDKLWRNTAYAKKLLTAAGLDIGNSESPIIPIYIRFKSEYLHADSTQQFIDMTILLLTKPKFYQNGVNISEELIKEFDQESIKQQLIQLYHSRLNNYYQILSDRRSRWNLFI